MIAVSDGTTLKVFDGREWRVVGLVNVTDIVQVFGGAPDHYLVSGKDAAGKWYWEKCRGVLSLAQTADEELRCANYSARFENWLMRIVGKGMFTYDGEEVSFVYPDLEVDHLIWSGFFMRWVFGGLLRPYAFFYDGFAFAQIGFGFPADNGVMAICDIPDGFLVGSEYRLRGKDFHLAWYWYFLRKRTLPLDMERIGQMVWNDKLKKVVAVLVFDKLPRLVSYDYKADAWTEHVNPFGLGANIFTLHVTPNGEVWVGGEKGGLKSSRDLETWVDHTVDAGFTEDVIAINTVV